jgi:hypothetical protein
MICVSNTYNTYIYCKFGSAGREYVVFFLVQTLYIANTFILYANHVDIPPFHSIFIDYVST